MFCEKRKIHYSNLLFFYCILVASASQPEQDTLNFPKSLVHSTNLPILIINCPTATVDFIVNDTAVRVAIDTGICKLTGASDITNAWKHFLNTNDVLGIKVFTKPGPVCGTRVGLVGALVSSIIASGILPNTNIIIWDHNKVDLTNAGFLNLEKKWGIQVLDVLQTGYDTNVFYENPIVGNLNWGDVEFGLSPENTSRKSRVTRILSQKVTRLFLITPLVYHPRFGICGHLYHLGLQSVDNTQRFIRDQDTFAIAIPEICAIEQIGDKLALCITDALLCQYEGGPTGQPHYVVPLNQIWIGTDPIATDLLGLQQIQKVRQKMGLPLIKRSLQLWENASLLQLGTLNTNNLITVWLP